MNLPLTTSPTSLPPEELAPAPASTRMTAGCQLSAKSAVHACARVLFGKLLPKIAYPVLRGPLRGRRYFLGATAGDAGGVSVHLGLQEVEQSACLTSLLKAGQTFLDVGANVGFYSLLASRLVGPSGRVVALEPLPRNLSYLHRHLRLNRVENATILPFACAERLASELFQPGENHALGRLGGEGEGILVATISLDAVVARLSLAPDVVKIDVEGAELRVLEGATDLLTNRQPAIVLSTHSPELRESCLSYLERFRYSTEPLNSRAIDAATEFLARPPA